MKEKILAQLRLKFPGVPVKMLVFFADKLTATITTEDQIPGQIDELEKGPIKPSDFATYAQQDGDQRVTDAVKTHEANLKTKFKFEPIVAPANPPAPDPNSPNPAPADQKELLDRIAKLEKRELQSNLQSQLIQKLTEKKMPLLLAKGRTFETAEELESLVTELETDWTAHQQEQTNQAAGSAHKPAPGSEGYTGNIDKDIAAWAAKTIPVATPAAT